MKTPNLKRVFMLVATLLVITSFALSQGLFTKYPNEIAERFHNGQSQYLKSADFDKAYWHKDHQDILDSIGNSRWWDSLSDKAQIQIEQRMHRLPDDFSYQDLENIMAISLDGKFKNRKEDASSEKSSCPGGDVFLTSQDEVDAYGALGCTSVTGNLFIDDSGSAQKITDLTPLINLTSVDGIIEIITSQLTNLDGLSNLSSVGYFRLRFNEALTNLDGLSSLTESTGPELGPCSCSPYRNRIDYNPLITDLSGLSNLTHIADAGFFIQNNNALQSLNGLQNLPYVGGTMDIADNSVLQNLQGLSSFTGTSVTFVIRGNPVFEKFHGAPNFATVGGAIIIDNNASLKNLEGLSTLTTVNSTFAIHNNPILKNLEGLNSLTHIGSAEILNNPILKNLEGLEGITSINRDMIVYNNASLKNVDGISNLTTVGGWMVLQELPLLKNIDGLSSLTWVGELMGLATCPLITNVDALSNLTEVAGLLGAIDMAGLQNLDGFSNVASAGELWVFLNPSLTSCCGIYQLLCADPPACSTDAVAGAIDMFANGAGCTVADIIAGGPCTPPALSAPEGTAILPDSYLESQIGFSVYPNPAKDEVWIQFGTYANSKDNIEVFNSMGQLVYQVPAHRMEEGLIKLDIQSWENGVYLIQINTEDSRITRRLVRQK